MYFKGARSRKLMCFSLSVILLIGLLVFVGCASPEPGTEGTVGEPVSSDEVYELNLAHFQPPVHEVETVLIQGWIEAIDEATGGRVKITSYPGGTLLPGTEIFEGVVDGAADIGHSVYAYTRGGFPVIETLLVPGLEWPNAKVADWVLMDLIEHYDPEELHGVKHLFSWTTGRGDLLIQEPVSKMEDLSGLVIGVTAGERADALARLGSTGHVAPMPDQYEGIARGLTAGTIAPMETLKSFRIAEVVDYVTITPMLYNQLLFMVMNIDTWNSLPPDIQQTIDTVTEEYYVDVVAGFYDWLEELAVEWIEEEGIQLEITHLSAEEQQRWVEKIEPMFEDQINHLNNQGLPGEEIFDNVLELIDENAKKYAN